MQSVLRKSLIFLTATALVLTMSLSGTLGFGTAHAAQIPQKIKLSTQGSLNKVDIGGKLKISVKTVPGKASKNAEWKIVSGKKYASLSKKKGSAVYVTGKKTGTVKIKATSAHSKKISKMFKVKVVNLKAKKLTVSSSVSISNGKIKKLSAKVTAPQKYGYKKQTTKWSSSDTKIASVSKKGVVTANAIGTAKITASNDGKKAVCTVTVPEKSTIRGFVLAGSWSKSKIDTTPVASDAKVQVWNKDTNGYEIISNTKKNVYGNFIKLEDTDSDGTADIVSVVKREDSSKMWDKDMTWKSGVGDSADPSINDATGKTKYSAKNRIPLGQRLLDEFGIGDYCGVNDFSDLSGSTYWTSNNYYSMPSGKRSGETEGNGLTMLTGYKTLPQAAGWSCVMASMASVLEWYGERGDLNEEDLASLRGADRERFAGGTSLKELENAYDGLNDLGIGSWDYVDSNMSGYEDKLSDSAWVQDQLKQGHPIQVIWNSYGAHGQVIIGYDDMSTPDDTADDVLIMMDPYDTTDQNNDGYIVQSYERLAYGTLRWDGETTGTKFLVAYPKSGWNYTQMTGTIPSRNVSNTIKHDNANKLNAKLYGLTAKNLAESYDSVETGTNPLGYSGLSGAALYEEASQQNNSPYYKFYDYYNYRNGSSTSPTKTLKMVEKFRTIQQSTEWTCGCTSALMVMEKYGKNGTDSDPFETDISLSKNRQGGKPGATYLSGMKEIFDYMNTKHGQDWVTFSRNDMTDPDSEWSTYKGKSGTEYVLQAGRADNGLIPYLIDQGIPVMIGSDDWGGHWQVIVGYDDMETTQTQDDVLIVAEPYDTTDHECDGYYAKPFERLIFGWNSSFEEAGQGTTENDFIVAIPKSYNDTTKAVADELGMK